jgi:hypothetical protein
MFDDLFKGDLPRFSINFGVITLVHKIHDSNLIQQYRPICKVALFGQGILSELRKFSPKWQPTY